MLQEHQEAKVERITPRQIRTYSCLGCIYEQMRYICMVGNFTVDLL